MTEHSSTRVQDSSRQVAPQSAFDAQPQQRAERFAERIAHMLDSGAVALMLSLGHKSGLLETLASAPPATSLEIANRARLTERYVREWLAAMVTAGIVSYDPQRKQYALPQEHAASLTRNGELGNLAVYAQAIAMGGKMEERLLECFATGSGIQYAEYPGFHQMMAEDSAQTVAAHLAEILGELAPSLVLRLDEGIEVLDAGCGSGGALRALARQFPKSRLLGIDLCADAIAVAQRQAHVEKLSSVRYEVRDLTSFDEVERYDLITSFDAVHDTPDPQDVLRRLYRALRPGGTHLMQDIAGSAALENNVGKPFAPFLYTISCLHCVPVSVGQGGLGLGTMWGWETALDMLKNAGFSSIRTRVLAHDPMNVWFLSQK